MAKVVKGMSALMGIKKPHPTGCKCPGCKKKGC